jgi:hypothetical protein
MERQLALIDPEDHDWKLDDETRERGMEGVRAAREALRLALAEQHDAATHSHAA